MRPPEWSLDATRPRSETGRLQQANSVLFCCARSRLRRGKKVLRPTLTGAGIAFFEDHPTAREEEAPLHEDPTRFVKIVEPEV